MSGLVSPAISRRPSTSRHVPFLAELPLPLIPLKQPVKEELRELGVVIEANWASSSNIPARSIT